MIPGSNRDHPTFVRSFGYALEGFVTAVTTERNIKVQLCVGAAAVVAGVVLRIDALSWVLVVLCIGLVIFAELVNTAIEAIVDLATQELHPLAKRAKDIAAASVFTLSITAAIVGIIVFARAIALYCLLSQAEPSLMAREKQMSANAAACFSLRSLYHKLCKNERS